VKHALGKRKFRANGSAHPLRFFAARRKGQRGAPAQARIHGGGSVIPFTKAHACGNDFLIVREDAVADEERAPVTRRLCARHTGVGADGVEFFHWTGPASARVRLHNADGSTAEISGNGTRCAAAWMAEELGCRAGDRLRITTDAGVRECRVDKVDRGAAFTAEITIGMGVPVFVPHTVRLGDGTEIVGVEVSTGNPHFVVVVDDALFLTAQREWKSVGAEICGHRDFPAQTNVEFVRVGSEHEMEIRIFERGVGPTSSSGTGTAAAATAALALHRCTSPVTVLAPGGAQTVEWSGPGTELFLTGPAALIARGEAY
jgi:diaminopimelate epimerase